MRWLRFRISALCVSMLVACGGGGSGSSGDDSPIVSPSNTMPVANPGVNQEVSTGEKVTLDGSGSIDPDGDELSYQWVFRLRPEGSTATLSSTDAVRPTFTADKGGKYVAELTVYDGEFYSEPASTEITATDAEIAPVANAGKDQNVSTGTLVSLNGSASSDSNGRSLAYAWTIVKAPVGSNTVLQRSTSVDPVFTPDTDGEYVIQLIVSNGMLSSEPARVTVTAESENSAPVADAGPEQTVMLGDTVRLDGSQSSDADHNPLNYKWTFTKRPADSGAVLSGLDTATPTFIPDVPGEYVIQLVVNDGKLDSEVATTLVNVVASSVHLYEIDDGLFGGNEEEVSLPYNVNATKSGSLICSGNCPLKYVVAKYRIEANGADFSISDLSAINLTGNNNIKASFSGIQNGTIIRDGQSVNFELESDFTKGQTVVLRYRFTIPETQETFEYNVNLTTN